MSDRNDASYHERPTFPGGASRGSAIPEGAYRCSECGHGDRLYACAEAIVSGRLLPDGTVTEDDTMQFLLCESSIDCTDHPLPGHLLERWFRGAWTRWTPCTHTEPNARFPAEVGYRCVGGAWTRYSQRLGVCPACDGKGGHWLAVPQSPTHPGHESEGT